jgi:hypothetical protein
MSSTGCALQESRESDGRSSDRSPVVEAALNRLRGSPYPSIRRVDCSFELGRLRLRGKLHSYFHKQLAQEAVARLPGVTQVINDTDVSEADERRST